MEIAIKKEQEFTAITLVGVINEDNALADQIEGIPGNLLLINLRDVELINSCGVRDWVKWIKALEAKGAQVLLLECSPAIVSQVNAVNNFTGAGAVKSFFLPYFCQTCDREQLVLCEAAELVPPPPLPPAQLPPPYRCNVCQQVMEFDDLPSAYFLFLANPRKIANPEKIPVAALQFSKPRARVMDEPQSGVWAQPKESSRVGPKVAESSGPPFLAIGIGLLVAGAGIAAYLLAFE